MSSILFFTISNCGNLFANFGNNTYLIMHNSNVIKQFNFYDINYSDKVFKNSNDVLNFMCYKNFNLDNALFKIVMDGKKELFSNILYV